MPAAPATPKPRKRPAAPQRRPKKAPPPRVWPAVAMTAALVFLLDQALKFFVLQVLDLRQVQEIDVFDPWLNLRMAWNQGMNFGLFSSETEVMRWVLIAIALAVCLWVAIWIGRTKPSRFAQISAGLLIGGALGNVVDRLVHGAVADFLNMSLPGWQNPYSFNVADIAIFLGAMGLVLQPPEKRPAPKARKAPPRPRAPKVAGPGAASPEAAAPGAQAELPLDDKPRDGAGNPR
ncbi:signal peptidase II [Paracoccus sp. (in: a-proteobacteria)]|uniref:signal peptidase II n=1 Tax=Paracoccus sp. TaxID=267 RepID=UPI00321FBC34